MRKFNAIEKWLKGSVTVSLLDIQSVANALLAPPTLLPSRQPGVLFRRKTKLSLETAQVARHYEIVKMRYKLFE